MQISTRAITSFIVALLSLSSPFALPGEPATAHAVTATITLTVTIPEKTYIAAIDKTIHASPDTTVATVDIHKNLRYRVVQAQ
ncbi:hypothetical protein SIN8267_02197 [Sinobacterium norvegicum]|uniref:Uncharacterized protein n=1 Tax=Sinobacterium norvegicum TaxID=1641715 RepID=A0ABN8EL21_9GAMM|nr:hypothetical protein [Sinobacterium norvegicum]CAH0992082.1 hypothetical protein SIN8267_02197 [Sinobacterium norvegicum]